MFALSILWTLWCIDRSSSMLITIIVLIKIISSFTFRYRFFLNRTAKLTESTALYLNFLFARSMSHSVLHWLIPMIDISHNHWANSANFGLSLNQSCQKGRVTYLFTIPLCSCIFMFKLEKEHWIQFQLHHKLN